jgi:competence protein ComGC
MTFLMTSFRQKQGITYAEQKPQTLLCLTVILIIILIILHIANVIATTWQVPRGHHTQAG